MLLIPRTEGVETKGIKSSYSSAAGTAYITFDNVLVPVENLLGKEGKGIYVILRFVVLPFRFFGRFLTTLVLFLVTSIMVCFLFWRSLCRALLTLYLSLANRTLGYGELSGFLHLQ